MRVELDGQPWRTLPAAAVVETRLVVGVELDRLRARELRRELRRQDALTLATKALTHRPRSTAAISATLERKGVAASEQAEAIDVLQRAGYLDDSRFATARAATLVGRGYGDDGIRFDLQREGLSAELIESVVAGLEPESARARTIAARAGRTAKTARNLAAKGFSDDAVETAVGASLADGF